MSNEIPTPSILELNGKSYRVTPITLSDQLEIASYFRDQYMADVNRQIVGLPKEVATSIWSSEHEKASKIEVGSTEFHDRIFKPWALTYALYLAIRHEDKSFTLADAKEAFNSKQRDDAIDSALDALGYERSNPYGDGESEGDDAKKK